MNHIQLATTLYKLNRDPLTLDAIRVLADPTDPNYETAKQMVERMEEARKLLFPPA